jgi:hypothetical protein
MISALIQLIISPEKAWKELSHGIVRQQYLPLLLVYPMLIITALSAYVHYWYGYVSLAEATQEALTTILKYAACIITIFILLVKLGRKYYAAEYSKSQAHLFAGYIYTITLLSVLINNLLPSDFAFVQFMPLYIIWVVYQGREYLNIPSESTFSYTVITSVIFMALPYAWGTIFDIITH